MKHKQMSNVVITHVQEDYLDESFDRSRDDEATESEED
jgi:hypothetical protein